eukprot:jgi/Mesvir1/7188/Mv19016-RA.2
MLDHVSAFDCDGRVARVSGLECDGMLNTFTIQPPYLPCKAVAGPCGRCLPSCGHPCQAHCDRSWREISLGTPLRLPARDGSCFTVTAYDANHMRGSAMFLFEGAWKDPLGRACRRILHTGDACLDTETIARVPMTVGPGPLVDILLLDCTFGDFPWDFKDRDAVVEELLKGVDAYSTTARVYVAAPLGNEGLLARICQKYNTKVFVAAAAPATNCKPAKRSRDIAASGGGDDRPARKDANAAELSIRQAAERWQTNGGTLREEQSGVAQARSARRDSDSRAEWDAASRRRAELRALGLEGELLTAESSARFHLLHTLEGLPSTAHKSKSDFFQGERAVLKDVNNGAQELASAPGETLQGSMLDPSSLSETAADVNSGEKPPMYIRTSAQILKTLTQDFKMQLTKSGCAFQGGQDSNLLRGFISHHSSQRQLIAAVRSWQPAHVMVTAGAIGGELKKILTSLP